MLRFPQHLIELGADREDEVCTLPRLTAGGFPSVDKVIAKEVILGLRQDAVKLQSRRISPAHEIVRVAAEQGRLDASTV